ncbi:DMT family transporter [Sulfitobacter albidus]|uniref:DMT family transporter n=1 Tax=Sulfitobacter albidus TaxID=2829501 RepID=A0A975JB58_9RHOB|nr:DMT family transporter [Sulfitobacter albidus]QUJ75254.1 DMT family transporter [Sulfitobacter albidus]
MQRLLPLFLLLVTGAMLGATTNMAKIAGEQGIAPLAFVAWSITGAAIVLGVVAFARGNLPAINARTLEYFVIAAFVTTAATNLIFFSAVPRVGASFVALAISFPPLLTYLGALALGMERFDVLRASGVALALAGAVVLAAYQLSVPDASVFWIILTLCGPVLLAIGNLYRTLRWPEGETGDALAPGMLAAAAVMLLLAGFLPGFTLSVPQGGLPYLLIIVQIGLFAGQFLLLFALQKVGGPVLLSLLGAVGAITGVPVAIFALGEAPPAGLIYAVPLIFAGIALVTWGGLRATRADTRT